VINSVVMRRIRLPTSPSAVISFAFPPVSTVVVVVVAPPRDNSSVAVVDLLLTILYITSSMPFFWKKELKSYDFSVTTLGRT